MFRYLPAKVIERMDAYMTKVEIELAADKDIFGEECMPAVEKVQKLIADYKAARADGKFTFSEVKVLYADVKDAYDELVELFYG